MPPKKKKNQKKAKGDQSSASEDLPDPDELQVKSIDGVWRNFKDYTRDFTTSYYPGVRTEPIMIPPVAFHQNWLVVNKEEVKKLKGLPGSQAFEKVTVADFSDKNESTRRSSVAEYLVALGFQHLAQNAGGPSTIILGHKFENYLSKVKEKIRLSNVKTPSDVLPPGRKGRGEIDLMFIRPANGILVVSVKSIGGNFAEMNKSEAEQADILGGKFDDAIEQLALEVKVVNHVLTDISPPVTCTMAFPNIRREMLTIVLGRDASLKAKLDGLLKGDSLELIICSEELCPVDPSTDSRLTDQSKGRLEQWFKRRFPDSTTFSMSLDDYEDIIGRYCGLFSIVDIPNRSKGRIEVRRERDAVTEVSRRFRSLLLLPEQVALLSSPHRRVYMSGLMGSGKSVMLRLKAGQWLTDDCDDDVIIINVAYDADGSPIGHVLKRDIKDGCRSSKDGAQIGLVNVKLSAFDEDKFVRDVYSTIKEMSRSKTKPDEAAPAAAKATSSSISASNTASSDASRQTTSSSGITSSQDEPSTTAVTGPGNTSQDRLASSEAVTTATTAATTTTTADVTQGVDTVPLASGGANSKLELETTEAPRDGSGSEDPSQERPVHFILDEVYPAFQPVFDVLMKKFPRSEIWAAGLEREDAPDSFHKVEFTTVLRNPPNVQKILQATDYKESRRSCYTTFAAQKGLPAEGPPPRFIHHQNHFDSPSSGSSSASAAPPPCTSSSPSSEEDRPYSFMFSYSPLHCRQCADEMLEILREVIGLPESAGPPASSSSTAGQPTATVEPSASTKAAAGSSTGTRSLPNVFPPPPRKMKKQQQAAGEAAVLQELSFRDVALLCKDPEAKRIYPKTDDKYKLDSGLFDEFVNTIDGSVFAKTLREGGCPVRAAKNVSSDDLAVPSEDAVSASWINLASGLEWPVVVFMPGDPPPSPTPAPPPSPLSLEEVLKKLRMSERDVKYLFWAASRCTAQMIVIVP